MNNGLKFYCSLLLLVILNIEAACSKSDDGSALVPGALPVLTAQDLSVPRGITDSFMRFYVSLSKSSSMNVSAKYRVVDGTATAPKDFVATSGTVTFSAGQTSTYFDVIIKGDSLRQANTEFTINFTDSKNCTLSNSSVKGTIINTDGTSLATDNAGYTTPLTYTGYTLTWSDEFSTPTVDKSAWNFESGGNGWGNNELENYTGRLQNVFQSNGNLIIEARNEAYNGNNYTSARLTTQNKKAFKFGRIDIRAKLPVTQGMWPALWMLGSNISTLGWPTCGEIDIMELVGSDPKKVLGTAHYTNAGGVHDSKGGSQNLASGDFSQKFHVFSIIWKQDAIEWLIDDQPFYTMTEAMAGTSNYPFNNDFFLLLNVAVGGNWPGPPNGTTNFPQRMFVDYVRVFQ